MIECFVCANPIPDGDEVQLISPTGETICVHGMCFLKAIPARAFDQDEPGEWAATNVGIDEWTKEMQSRDKDTY